jgi:hypothetical protein
VKDVVVVVVVVAAAVVEVMMVFKQWATSCESLRALCGLSLLCGAAGRAVSRQLATVAEAGLEINTLAAPRLASFVPLTWTPLQVKWSPFGQHKD